MPQSKMKHYEWQCWHVVRPFISSQHQNRGFSPYWWRPGCKWHGLHMLYNIISNTYKIKIILNANLFLKSDSCQYHCIIPFEKATCHVNCDDINSVVSDAKVITQTCRWGSPWFALHETVLSSSHMLLALACVQRTYYCVPVKFALIFLFPWSEWRMSRMRFRILRLSPCHPLAAL